MIQKLLNRLSGNRAAEQALHLGVFGKHPAWADHLPDFGMQSDQLYRVKRVLYLEGVGNNLEGWDRLSEEERLDGFHHVFLWQMAQEWLLGRVWSSADGKGRTRYPMVACVHAIGNGLADALPIAASQLARFEADCRVATAAEDVQAITEDLQARFRDIAYSSSEPPPDPAAALAVLASRPEMGPEWVGLIRLLYEIEHAMPDCLRTRGRRRGPGTDAGRVATDSPAHHVRVPRCAVDADDALALWAAFVRETFAPRVPAWVLCPLDHPWVDLIIGPAGPAQLFCLRTTPKRHPLVTDIPYEIDRELEAELRARVERVGLS